VDFLPFSKLTQVSISPRIRNILESAYQLCWREIEAGLKRTLDDYERELFRKADKAETNDAQNRFFEALKVVRKSNSTVLIAMRDELQRGMMLLINPVSVEQASNGKTPGRLALIDNTTLELELAISEIAARAEMKCTQALSYAAIRFSVVTGGAPISVDDVPVGPHRILAALAKGIATLDLRTDFKVELMRTFDKVALLRMPDLIEAINKQFCDQRVFAHLNLGLGRKPEAKEKEKEVSPDGNTVKQVEKQVEKQKVPAASPPSKEPAASEVQRADSQAGREKSDSAQSQPVATAPAARPTSPTPAAVATNRFNLFAQPEPAPFASNEAVAPPAAPSHSPHGSAADPFGLSGPVPSARPPGAAPSDIGAAAQRQAAHTHTHTHTGANDHDSAENDQELFTTLRELLSGRRSGGQQKGAEAPHAGPIATAQDVQSVLTVLQAQPATPVMVAGRWKSRRIADIQHDLLGQLSQMHGGQTPKIEQETSDTLELVGMLFDHVLSDSKPSSTTHSLLTKLQVPILKVALKDKSFFSRRNHPARQLLGTIAENGMFWSDGDDVDQALVERMQMVVDRITADFDNDVGVFETMLGDLGRHVSTLQRKAEVSEKRYVEAAKGREKLEVARKNATASIETFVKGRLLPPLVVHLLEGAWADVLALTQLRQDVSSPMYQERLEVAEMLAGCFDLDNPVSKDDFLELKPILEEGMSLVGFHGPEIERTLHAVGELVVEGDALVPALEPAEEREVTELVRSKARIGQDQDAPKTSESAAAQEKQSILAHLRKDEKTLLSPKETQTLERLKQMPFGTWFEFVLNQQGDVARRKLSWFSPVTGRCLFVNSRGAKVAEKSMEELARDLVRGNAKLWEPGGESVIDRAWKTIKEKLKSWTQNDMSVSERAAAGA
jgi:hypothetical protein